MALKNKWIDRKDGDEIRPEDINDVANAVIDNEKALEDKAPKDHTHGLAGIVTNSVSLIGITSGGSGAEVNSISDTEIIESVIGTYNIDVKGDVELIIQSNAMACTVSVDGIVILDNGHAISNKWSGKVEQGIEVVLNDGFIKFKKFTLAEYTDGFMTGEQAEKLANTPTTEDVQNMVNEAFGIVAEAFDEVHEYAESLGGDEA